jgi:hypothetical protein
LLSPERTVAHLVIDAEDDVDVPIVIAFGIVVQVAFTIVKIRVNDLVAWHQASRVGLGFRLVDGFDLFLFVL